jgi:putative ABC transport system permease protein
MTMFRLALTSMRYRLGGLTASFLNVLLGATILMAFASLFDTGMAAGVSDADETLLTTMAWVVGGWGVLIVAFGVAATLNLSVRQRATEIALLKSANATPAQIGRMVIGEVVVVSVVASVLAIPGAYLVGRAVLAALVDTGQVASGIDYTFGVLALGIGLGNTFLAAAIAAFITARRAATVSTREALLSAAVDRPRLGKKRVAFGVLFLLAGVDAAVLTATIFKDEGFTTEALAGQACINTSIGLALFAPTLLRFVARLVGPPLRLLSGAGGYLATVNVRQRAHRTAGVLMPIIMFIGMAAGSLYMQEIQNNANATVGQTSDEKAVETLNFIIVSMIAVFAAVVLVNIAITSTLYRRREFGQDRLIGSTPSQVMRMLSVETLVVAITGVIFGAVAALAAVIPYSIALTDKAVPDVGPEIGVGVLAAAIVLTFVANLGAGRRAIHPPALEAVAVTT